MSPSKGFFNNQVVERQTFIRRAVLAGVAAVLLACLLIAQMLNLQIKQHEHFSVRSKENRIRVKPLPPTRGVITDRQGRLLAENLPAYRLELIPEQVSDLDKTLALLHQLVEFSEGEEAKLRKNWRRRSNFEPVPLKFRIDDEEMARIAVNQYKLPGVVISSHLTRHYPYGASTAHVVGYVGRLDPRDLANVDASNYAGTTHYGKTGIERSYETELHGSVGEERIETNAAGRQVRVVATQPPIPGKNIQLSLDIEFQQYAEAQLGEHSGSIVAIDPNNGQVLAFVSKPSYDPNLFVNGISHADYNSLNQNTERPLFNRALKGQYPPGSTIKQLVGLAGLELGLVNSGTRLLCPGYYLLPHSEHRYRDWKRSGHGSTNLDKALVQSCDVYFYDLARNLGIDRMHDYLARFGLGQTTGIDLDGERRGLLPSSAWKRRTKNQSWYPGETLITGIGQGFMLTTPLQLAHSTAILAHEGEGFVPHFNLQITPTPIPSTNVPKRHLRNVKRAMYRVTNSGLGTARSLSEHHHFDIAGKTGTAQVYALSQNDEDEDAKVQVDIPKRLRDHALFVGYAPLEQPKIAVAIIAENGGSGGAVAAPIAGRVMEWWLNNSDPKTAPETTTESSEEKVL